MYTLVGDDGACPYFWPIGDRHMLLFFSHMSGGQYLLGDYDTERDKFIVTAGAKNNFGAASPAGVHAPSATPDGDGGLIVIYNMNPAKPTKGWNQIMTLPASYDPPLQRMKSELSQLNVLRRHRIAMRYAHQHSSMRSDVLSHSPIANEEVVLEGINGNAIALVFRCVRMELEMEIDVKSAKKCHHG